MYVWNNDFFHENSIPFLLHRKLLTIENIVSFTKNPKRVSNFQTVNIGTRQRMRRERAKNRYVRIMHEMIRMHFVLCVRFC